MKCPPSFFILILAQVVLGRDYDETELMRLSQLYKVWSGGLLAWPYINLPFTPYWNAMKAKEDLFAHFQVYFVRSLEALISCRICHGVAPCWIESFRGIVGMNSISWAVLYAVSYMQGGAVEHDVKLT
jgi:hypothetical protein